MMRFFWAVAAVVALLLPVEAWQFYPMPETDALWFLPPAVQYARDGDEHLFNHLHPQAQAFDTTGTDLFVFYPPGLPWFLGALTPRASPRAVYVLLALVCSAVVLLTARLLARRLRTQTVLGPGTACGLGSAGLLAVGTYASSFCLGRPDYLATLLLLVGWAGIERSKPERWWLWAGVTLGFVAFTQPVAGFLAAAFLGAWAAFRLDGRRLALAMFPAYALAVAVLALLLLANPNGFDIIVEGVRRHAAETLVHGTTSPFLKFFVLHSYAAGFGVLFAAGLALIVRAIATGRLRPLSRGWLILYTLAFAVLFQHFVSIAWNRLYNLWLFTPFLVLLYADLGFPALARAGKRARRALLAAAGVLLFIGSFGLVHRTALFGFFLADGVPAGVARAEMMRLFQGEPPGRIGVSKSLWVLFADYTNIRSFSLDPRELMYNPPRYFLLQQRYTQLLHPQEIPGYVLRYDNFSPDSPRILGVALSTTVPSYRFALYERTAPYTAALPAPPFSLDALPWRPDDGRQ